MFFRGGLVDGEIFVDEQNCDSPKNKRKQLLEAALVMDDNDTLTVKLSEYYVNINISLLLILMITNLIKID